MALIATSHENKGRSLVDAAVDAALSQTAACSARTKGGARRSGVGRM
jgi:hypothetical protein